MVLDAGATNSLCHSLIIASWNCVRAVTNKMEDIKLFIEKYRPHLLAISETDLHGQQHFVGRGIKFTTDEIYENLKVEGIILPDTWHLFSQARIIAYASDDINFKKREIPDGVNFLPNIFSEVGIGWGRKSLINFFYCEWTSGADGDSSLAGQIERFSKQAEYWRLLQSKDKDLVLLGDANYCALLCAALFYDLSSAFDSIDNGILFAKLQ